MIEKSDFNLQQQWITLHNNVEKSESLALILKMLAVLVLVAGLIAKLNVIDIVLLLLVLWLQEGIWKTFQSRTESHLLALEKASSDNDEKFGLSFYSEWNESRPGIKKLIFQYISNSLRPTVAYPYVVLLLISFMPKIISSMS
ncbi:MAG: hypothetical protein HOM14_09305 [Gammaproteobacteria bacterium]|jgi:hypothetical protein|nr:hypothetical protein [Gammaproteobacteria bacterium]MBT3724448.1 hypothetical protein [Gammaproteobacteria bacterium]MBT4076409.1 hypothetical protein [Gammaproteobacteria bacterium]MBT4195618.1 hypothetical protein [Gammaproteobacteria bacterium]MBT4450549.1 hypothetical protein [Gammaproteobacteria bacterium]